MSQKANDVADRSANEGREARKIALRPATVGLEEDLDSMAGEAARVEQAAAGIVATDGAALC